MKIYIQKFDKQLKLQKQAEMYDFSLNKTITFDSNAEFGNEFLADSMDQFQSVEMKLLISNLDDISKQICRYLFQGYSTEEICSFLNITADTFRMYRKKLQNHFKCV